ncbi:sigma-70 family RNA polymerase sigma factor [Fulvivirga sp. 29W222]|uniref:Sigma-70 family RNA polymerase sigma factor n=1 Tax=Fulvivirga marina TaxID=2494733 RepID=A0A937FU99_9BACT|nr:sigma-70 family RNA polymerase sigma factor [Fulvivirga marina]MBL6445078.1 sigma-70 family RNA polymerase sigma factor [Fulvivirga marina]
MYSEKELADQFLKDRSEEAFRVLYRMKTPGLFRLALQLCRQDQYLAEEAIQEMWIIGVRKLNDFQWRSNLQTWLTGILINVVKGQQRKNIRQQDNLEESLQGQDNVVLPEVFTSYDLREAISRLPDGYQQIIILHDIEGYTHKEIGEMLNINDGTSKSQLFNARKAVRTYLSEKHTKQN